VEGGKKKLGETYRERSRYQAESFEPAASGVFRVCSQRGARPADLKTEKGQWTFVVHVAEEV
jgi:hypothetical protein